MSLLIATTVQTSMRFVSIKLSLLLTDTTTIITITAYTTQLFGILLTNATVVVHTQLHTRLTEFLLTVTCFV